MKVAETLATSLFDFDEQLLAGNESERSSHASGPQQSSTVLLPNLQDLQKQTITRFGK